MCMFASDLLQTCWSRCIPHCIELSRVYRQTDDAFIHVLDQVSVPHMVDMLM